MKIKFVRNSVLDSEDCLAQCVAKTLAFKRHLERAFGATFGRVGRLVRLGKGVGEVAYLRERDRTVYYPIVRETEDSFMTKRDFEQALTSLRDQCIRDGTRRLSIAKHGFVHTQMPWSQSSGIIFRVFKETNMVITIHSNLRER